MPTAQSQPSAVTSAALFGKLPTALDFVRVHHTHPLGIELDSWLQAAHQTLLQSGASWPEARVRFLYAPAAHASCLVGVLAPSRDRAGRRYPLAVYGAVRRSLLATYVPAAPLACARFVSELDAVLELAATASREQLAQQLGTIQPITTQEVSARHVELTHKLCTWSARQFMADLFHADLPDRAEHALLALMRATGAKGSSVVDLPAREPLHLAAWLALLARRAGVQMTLPSLFWIEEPSAARALLCLGAPPGQVPLWLAERKRKSERLLRLDTANAPTTAEQLARVAIDGGTLQELFERVARLRVTE
jgi:type VI secretion system ImpM family protein